MIIKKAVVVALAVAILGALGLYADKKPASSLAATSVASTNSSNQSTVQGASTQTTASSASTTNSSAASAYKDGSYAGTTAETPYGSVRVTAVISGGKIVDILFMKMPNDQGHSKEVTAAAEPLLKQTTLAKQSANIDFVSGATSTAFGYQESLQAALDKAAI